MIYSWSRTLYKFLLATAASAAVVYASSAHAELSIGALGGISDFTAQIRGDGVYDYGGAYYAYPQDINKRQGAVGAVARYLYPLKEVVFIGAETGYVYLGIDETRRRADDYTTPSPIPQWVENVNVQATGLVLLNAVAGVQLTPTVKFMLFGGPAWLNTKYTANDFFDGYVVTAKSTYQSAADFGTEVDWSFLESWSAGVRYDYIFNTKTRTVSSIGEELTAMEIPMTAKSNLTLFTFTLRYLIPNT